MIGFFTRRGSGVVLLTAIVLLSVLLNFLPIVSQRLAPQMDLSGVWDYCRAGSVETCRWERVRLPGRFPHASDSEGSSLFLRTSFRSPDFCVSRGEACELLIGTISDPADAYLNGTHIGRVGEPPPTFQYSQVFPGRFFVAGSALRAGKLNELILKVYPVRFGGFGFHGVTRGPVAIYSSRTAGLIAETFTAGTVFLPLFTALGLIALLSVSLLLHKTGGLGADDSRRTYFYYCIVACIYQISLSRLPREYLPEPLGFAVHFGFKFLQEFFFLSLVARFFGHRSALTRLFRGLLVLFAISCFGLSFSPVYGGSWLVPLGLWGILLCPYTSALGFFLSIESKSSRIRVPTTGALFLFLFLMQCWDALALRGVVPDIYFARFSPLLVGIFFGRIFWKQSVEERQRIQVSAELGAFAAQVVHDVRSPLAALKMVARDLEDVPEEQRVLIRGAINRIQDIANSLLDQNRRLLRASVSQKGVAVSRKRRVVLLQSLLEEAVTEKRMQYRSRAGIVIESSLGPDSYGLFVDVDEVELKRMISNVINNSVEAIEDSGQVVVSLAKKKDQVMVRIRDNGRGIAPELISRLGHRGESYGKAGGSGLGLFHARTHLEGWGGRLRLSSSLGQETVVSLIIPSAPPPKWFVEKISLQRGAKVIVLDDDSSIHQIWDERAARLSDADDAHITWIHLFTPDQIRSFVQMKDPQAPSLYLVDYELLSFEENGLKLIEDLKLIDQSILVTSRYESEEIQAGCSRLGLKLIPKSMAEFVPIQIESAKHKFDSSGLKLGALASRDVH